VGAIGVVVIAVAVLVGIEAIKLLEPKAAAASGGGGAPSPIGGNPGMVTTSTTGSTSGALSPDAIAALLTQNGVSQGDIQGYLTLNAQESSYGANQGPSSGGAIGPWQFISDTWTAYGSGPFNNAWNWQASTAAVVRYINKRYGAGGSDAIPGLTAIQAALHHEYDPRYGWY
jgi:hypothetical protein